MLLAFIDNKNKYILHLTPQKFERILIIHNIIILMQINCLGI